ncbi:MAG TPA: PAS domain S-box protein [Candidatus Saccharimonadales bacterium]|nr:PAS domain S-box protein [Candidatus Saccharimonadales bacterium]
MHRPLSAHQVSTKKEISVSPITQSVDKLHSSELRYRRLFETAQDGILILDADSGKIADANPFLKEILGYSHGELLGKALWEIGVFKDIKESKEAFIELQNKGYIRYKDLPLQTKDGQSIDVEFVSNAYMVGSERVIQCNIRDITERRKADEAIECRTKALEELSKSQEETKQAMFNVMEDLEDAKTRIQIEKVKDEAMFASIGEGLIAIDNNRNITIVNKAAEDMLGWKMKELIGKEITTLPLEDEEGNAMPFEKRPAYMVLSSGKAKTMTSFFVKKDKTRFPIAINVTPIILEGKTIGLIETLRDITREKEIDRAKTEFVSLASHQLRTPLGIAKWYIEALIGEGYLNKAPAVAKEYFNEVYKSNERLLSLVRDLLSISRIDQGKIRDTPKLINIVDIIKDVLKEMNLIAAKNSITIQLEIKKPKIPSMFIDPLRLQEIIENLITNAIAYSISHGKVEIIVALNANTVCISVKDTGIGISKHDQKKLFTKFFRSERATVKNTQGSGLGLYVVKSYVDGWGGEIAVDSEEGKGSTFSIRLPILRKQYRKTT